MTTKLPAIRHAIALMAAGGALLKDAALTLGPPLLRLHSQGREGAPFAGLVREADHVIAPEGKADPLASMRPRQGERIAITCERCGSYNVTITATAKWDTRTQTWACVETFDDTAECGRCHSNALQSVPLSSAQQ